MSDRSERAERPTARIEVTGGGEVSPAELAAMVVALTPAGAAEGPRERGPAWARAALLENVGGQRISTRADLTRPGAPG